MSIRQEVKEVIEGCTAGLPYQIEYYTKFNQPVKIIDDTLSEIIGAMLNKTLCGGTGGGGYQGGPAYTSVWGDPPAPRLKHVRAAGGGRLDTRSTIYGSRGMFNREGLRIQNLNV